MEVLFKRRNFLTLAGATTLMPMSAFAARTLSYTNGLVDERLAAGETVFVDFKADWCTTCRVQERVISQLRRSNPAYDDAMTFVEVNWDRFARGQLANRLNIPRRSTLVVLKGEEELGRVVAQTARRQIQALMDVGLAAATA